MSCLKWGNLGTHGLVGGEQRRFADAAFLCPSPRSTPIVAWQAFAVERVNRKALALMHLSLATCEQAAILAARGCTRTNAAKGPHTRPCQHQRLQPNEHLTLQLNTCRVLWNASPTMPKTLATPWPGSRCLPTPTSSPL